MSVRTYVDTIKLRPHQQQVADVLLARAQEGDTEPVLALLAPGFGKELSAQNAVTTLFRAGLIDAALFLVPRTNLATAAERNWNTYSDNGTVVGGFSRLYEQPVPSFTWANGNGLPLPTPAYYTTFAAVAQRPDIHRKFIVDHGGRVSITVDELAFVGSKRPGEDEEFATKTAEEVAQLYKLSCIPPLLMTGAPTRYDGRMLAGLEHRYELNARGLLVPRAEVEGSYVEGCSRGWLRAMVVRFVDGLGKIKDGDRDGVSTTPADGDVPVTSWLEKEALWQGMVSNCLDSLRACRKTTKVNYCAGIACINTRIARAVWRWAKDNYPDFCVQIAVSADGHQAQEALKATRDGRVDVLVFVKQAFIGFDCPHMNHLAILNPGRHSSFLIQLVMRAGRVFNGDKYAYIYTLDDPKSCEFFALLREDATEGLRLREKREYEGGGQPLEGDRPVLTDVTFEGLRFETDWDERADKYTRATGVMFTAEQMEALDSYDPDVGENGHSEGEGQAGLIKDEVIAKYVSDTSEIVKAEAGRRRARAGAERSSYEDYIAPVWRELTKSAGAPPRGGKRYTLPLAEKRYKAAREMWGDA